MLWNGLQNSPPQNPFYWQLRLHWLIGSYITIGNREDRENWHHPVELWEFLPRKDWEAKLGSFHRFYTAFPDWNLITPQISWTHYLLLASIRDPTMRFFYLQESKLNQWSVKELQRQIQTGYYQRLIAPLTRDYMQGGDHHPEVQGFIKRHYILEFVEHNQSNMNERQLETTLMQSLPTLLLELGRGFSFVARQQRLNTATGKTFFVDLSFYHHVLRRFVLFELKVRPFHPIDIGQLEWYTHLYDQNHRMESDEPTVGVLLCPKTEKSRYDKNWLADKPHLYVATYSMQLPRKNPTDLAVDWNYLDRLLNQLNL